VWEDPSCTAGEGSPAAGHSLVEAGHNLEEVHRTAVVAGHTAAEAVAHTVAGEEEEEDRCCDHCCSSPRRDHDHLERHRQVLHGSHSGEAENLWWKNLWPS